MKKGTRSITPLYRGTIETTSEKSGVFVGFNHLSRKWLGDAFPSNKTRVWKVLLVKNMFIRKENNQPVWLRPVGLSRKRGKTGGTLTGKTNTGQ